MIGAEQQTAVNAHFTRAAHYWKDIYQARDVYAYIHQQRSALALEWVDALHLSAGARVLEIGCGTGLTSIALAQRGLVVDAMDSVAAMIDLAQQHVREAALQDSVTCAVGDCHKLQYANSSFDALVVMGVTPFLHSLPLALREMARVLKPGGHLLVNADNRRRLTSLLDPWLTTPGARLRRWLHRNRNGKPAFVARMYTQREFDRMLADGGFDIVRRRMLGFGPFTFFGRLVLSDKAGIKVHERLQVWADGGASIFRATGAQYVVLARKAPLV